MQLNNSNIDKTVADIQNFFERAEISKRDRIKINLIAEETLLRFQEKFGETQEFTIKTRQCFGTPKVIIRLKGKPFNPLETEDEIFSAETMRNLLNYETAGTSYSYGNGHNEIVIFSKKEKVPIKIPGGSITIAILLAVVCSFFFIYLPSSFQNFIIQNVTTPILNTLMKLIVGVTIPIIFISVVSSICIVDNITTLNDIGMKIIKRFIFIMVFIVIVSIFVGAACFKNISIEGNSNLLIDEIITLMLSVVPDSLFKPFIEGNVLQIIVIAFAFGACVVVLDKQALNLKNFITELKNVLFRIMEWTVKIIPFTIFLSVFKTIATTSFESIFVIWKAVAMSYITYFSVGAFMILYIKFKYNMGIKEFFKKNAPVFITATSMASGTASMMKNYDVCKKNLKIDPNFCDFWIPLSHTLFSPGIVISMVVCAFMGSIVSEATVSISQLLSIAFLTVQLSIVTPKVYGGNIASFTILLSQLGFSAEAIGPMMIVDMFTVNLSALFGMIVRNCEIFDLSHKVNFSNSQNT